MHYNCVGSLQLITTQIVLAVHRIYDWKRLAIDKCWSGIDTAHHDYDYDRRHIRVNSSLSLQISSHLLLIWIYVLALVFSVADLYS